MNRTTTVSAAILGCLAVVAIYCGIAQLMERIWPCGSANSHVQAASRFTAPYWSARRTLGERKIQKALTTIDGTYTNTYDPEREHYFGIQIKDSEVTVSEWSNTAYIRPGQYPISATHFEGDDLILYVKGWGGVLRQSAADELHLEWTEPRTSRVNRISWKRAWWGIKDG